MKRYYLNSKRGYFVTDDSISIHSTHHATVNALVAGRGPDVAWKTDNIQEQVFSAADLRTEINPATMPMEWQEALGYVPPVVEPPVVEPPVVESPVVESPVIEPTKSETTIVLSFAIGIFIGLVIAYFLTGVGG